MNVRILGISGTPIKDGNCDILVQEALKAAAQAFEGVETEFITLADKEIAACTHCQWCIENRAPCKVKDDFHMVYEAMQRADGIILGGPTWDLTLSPHLVNLVSRTRESTFFNHRFRNLPGGAVTLGWFGVGMEWAISVLYSLIQALEMVPVAHAAAVASAMAYGKRPDYMEHGVLDDMFGMLRVVRVGRKVAEFARIIKYGKEAGLELPRRKKDREFTRHVWRDKE
jgi:multimeric flavodoxin WrbA